MFDGERNVNAGGRGAGVCHGGAADGRGPQGVLGDAAQVQRGLLRHAQDRFRAQHPQAGCAPGNVAEGPLHSGLQNRSPLCLA